MGSKSAIFSPPFFGENSKFWALTLAYRLDFGHCFLSVTGLHAGKKRKLKKKDLTAILTGNR